MKAKPKSEDEIPEDGTAMLHDLEVDAYLKRAVHIEAVALEDEFVRLPSDIAYWNERHSIALRAYLDAKMDRERVLGTLMCDLTLVEELEAYLGKKPTVDQIKGRVLSDPKYDAAKRKENRTDQERTRLRGAVEALATKRDMLISLGAHVRLEMMHDPIVRRNLSRLRDVENSSTGDDDSDSDD